MHSLLHSSRNLLSFSPRFLEFSVILNSICTFRQVGFHRIGSEGKKLSSSLACVGLHRCSRIYGKGPQDWPGGVSLGTGDVGQKGSKKKIRRGLR
jgi:hypothetical protein